MTTERFNELLAGPLHHPLPMFAMSRLALALSHVVDATGEEGERALEDYCRQREESDERPGGRVVNLIEEQLTGAAIDAARISVSTAQFLVAHDPRLEVDLRAEILGRLEEGLQWLHSARELMPAVDPTSVHIIQPEGVIVPP